ncbi:MAG: hypothetical protein QOD88_452 [Mycobacterium sp.]|jgi:hypothetical protein|nr:hypothetical protein [Mycobacterium sp.]
MSKLAVVTGGAGGMGLWREARHLSDCTPSTALIDQLLDERAATSAGPRTNWSTIATMAARSAS